MGVPEKSDASKALKQIYDTVKQLYTLLKVFQIDLKENTELLKRLVNQGTGSSSGGTVTYEGMLNYIAQYPIWKLTDKQVYHLVERMLDDQKRNKPTYDMRYIQAVSGYKPEEIKKKYETHKKNNVY